MKLHRLRVQNFKGVEDRELRFPQCGVTVISGRNEIGKTSMIEAFDMLVSLRHNSRAAKVKAAQPVGRDIGVNVEAEFTIGDERVAVSRTWLKRPTTELQFTSGRRRGEKLAGDQAADALDQLWREHDTALWAASRLMQATGLDQLPLDESASLARALQAAAGGEALDAEPGHDLLALVRAETDRYFTANKRMPSGEYKRALDHLETSRVARDAAREGLLDLGRTREELDRVTDELRHRRSAIANAQQECAELGVQKAEVDRARAAQVQAEKLLAEQRLAAERALHELQTREELVTNLTKTRDDIEWLEQTRDEQVELLVPVNMRLAEVETEWQAADEQLRATGRTLEQARDDRDHLTRQTELGRLDAQLVRLSELRAQIAELEVAADSALTAELVDQLDQAAADLAKAMARIEVASAKLTVSAPQGGALLVDGVLTNLAPGQPWQHSVTAPLRLGLPDDWQLEISPAADEAGRQAAEEAGARLAELLGLAQVADVAEARQCWTKLAEIRAELAAARASRDELLGEHSETQLRDRVEQLRRQVDGYLATRNESEDALLAVLPSSAAEADELVGRAATNRDAARDLLATAGATLSKLRAERDERTAKLSDLAGQLGVLNRQAEVAEQELIAARSECDDQSITLAAEQAAEVLTAAERGLDRCVQLLTELDADRVLAQAADAQHNLAGLEELLAATREQQCTLVGELNGMNADLLQRTADEAESGFEQASREAESLRRRANAALRLEQTMVSHQEQAQRSYVEPFRAAVAELGRLTYADPEFDVQVADDLAITRRYLDGEWIDFAALSTGAKEQLVILIRLATAQLVNPDDRVPVLLDDALGYSDQPRLRRMWSALDRAGEHAQVIVMTANPERYAGLPQVERIEL